MAPWSEARIEGMRKTAEAAGNLEGFEQFMADGYQTMLDEENEWIVSYTDQRWREVDQGYGDDFRGLFIPRGSGFFLDGSLFYGEPTAFDPSSGTMIEFFFDEGVPASAEARDAEGDLMYALRRR